MTLHHVSTDIIEIQDRERVLDYMLSIDDSYSSEIKDFIRFVTGYKKPFTIQTITDYIEDLKIREFHKNGKTCRYSASAINKHIFALKRRIRDISRFQPPEIKDKIEEFLNELTALKINSKAVQEQKILSKEETKKLQQSMKENHPRLGLIFELIYSTGIRVSEAVNIYLTDIEETEKCFLITIRGKGGKERKVFAGKTLIQEIKRTFQGKKYLLETETHKDDRRYDRIYITKAIKKHARDVLGKDVTAHTLRHSFATHFLMETGNLKALSKYLGHSKVGLTMDLYVHSEATFDDISKVIG